MALDVVSDYVSDTRTLLQDTVEPFRYDDASLLAAFNIAILEARRLRADLFVGRFYNLPQFTAIDETDVPMEEMFRVAFVYGTAAHALLRDQEDIQDERGSLFKNVFEATLLGTRTPPLVRAQR